VVAVVDVVELVVDVAELVVDAGEVGVFVRLGGGSSEAGDGADCRPSPVMTGR